MVEDLICELRRPIKSIEMLLIFLQDYIEDDVVSSTPSTPREKQDNILAIVHSMDKVNKNMGEIVEKYYKLISQEKYHTNS